MSPSASALLLFALSRALVVMVVLAAVALMPIATPCGERCHLSSVPLLDALSRWDGEWYLGIASEGYGHAKGAQTDLAFFPLYPALMRAVGALAGGSDDAYLAAGVLISNVALALAAVVLARLIVLDHSRSVAIASIGLLLVFPTTVFLSAVYAESLFLLCAVAALYLARTERWPAAGIIGALGALARPFGVLVVVPLTVELALRRRFSAAAMMGIALPLVAFAGWMVVLWRMTGDPLAFFTAQAAYRRQAAAPFAAISDLFDPAVYGDPFFIIGFGGLTAILVVLSWRSLRASLAAYATVFFAAALSSGTLTSLLRYALAIFPIFVTLSVLPSPWFRRIYIVTAATSAVLFTAMFALWYWIG